MWDFSFPARKPKINIKYIALCYLEDHTCLCLSMNQETLSQCLFIVVPVGPALNQHRLIVLFAGWSMVCVVCGDRGVISRRDQASWPSPGVSGAALTGSHPATDSIKEACVRVVSGWWTSFILGVCYRADVMEVTMPGTMLPVVTGHQLARLAD